MRPARDQPLSPADRLEMCLAVLQLSAQYQQTDDPAPMLAWWRNWLSAKTEDQILDGLGTLSIAAAVAMSDHRELLRDLWEAVI